MPRFALLLAFVVFVAVGVPPALAIVSGDGAAVRCAGVFADNGNVLLKNGSTITAFSDIPYCLNCSNMTEEITALRPVFHPRNSVSIQKDVTSTKGELFFCFKPLISISKSFQLMILGLNRTAENDHNLVFNVSVEEKNSSSSFHNQASNQATLSRWIITVGLVAALAIINKLSYADR